MKKTYEQPVVEITSFEEESAIMLSGGGDGVGTTTPWEGFWS